MSCPACGMDNVHTIGCGHIELERLTADNTRLREALERIRGERCCLVALDMGPTCFEDPDHADYPCDQCIARAALEVEK